MLTYAQRLEMLKERDKALKKQVLCVKAEQVCSRMLPYAHVC
jgi:hypothetical protein